MKSLVLILAIFASVAWGGKFTSTITLGNYRWLGHDTVKSGWITIGKDFKLYYTISNMYFSYNDHYIFAMIGLMGTNEKFPIVPVNIEGDFTVKNNKDGGQDHVYPMHYYFGHHTESATWGIIDRGLLKNGFYDKDKDQIVIVNHLNFTNNGVDDGKDYGNFDIDMTYNPPPPY